MRTRNLLWTGASVVFGVFARGAVALAAAVPQTTVSGNAGYSYCNLGWDYGTVGTAEVGAHSTQGNIVGGAFTITYSDGGSHSGPVNFWPWQKNSPDWSTSNTHTFPRAGVYTATLTGYAIVQLQNGQQTQATFLAPTSAAYIRG